MEWTKPLKTVLALAIFFGILQALIWPITAIADCRPFEKSIPLESEALTQKNSRKVIEFLTHMFKGHLKPLEDDKQDGSTVALFVYAPKEIEIRISRSPVLLNKTVITLYHHQLAQNLKKNEQIKPLVYLHGDFWFIPSIKIEKEGKTQNFLIANWKNLFENIFSQISSHKNQVWIIPQAAEPRTLLAQHLNKNESLDNFNRLLGELEDGLALQHPKLEIKSERPILLAHSAGGCSAGYILKQLVDSHSYSSSEKSKKASSKDKIGFQRVILVDSLYYGVLGDALLDGVYAHLMSPANTTFWRTCYLHHETDWILSILKIKNQILGLNLKEFPNTSGLNRQMGYSLEAMPHLVNYDPARNRTDIDLYKKNLSDKLIQLSHSDQTVDLDGLIFNIKNYTEGSLMDPSSWAEQSYPSINNICWQIHNHLPAALVAEETF